MMDKVCETCAFWAAWEGSGQGECWGSEGPKLTVPKASCVHYEEDSYVRALYQLGPSLVTHLRREDVGGGARRAARQQAGAKAGKTNREG